VAASHCTHVSEHYTMLSLICQTAISSHRYYHVMNRFSVKVLNFAFPWKQLRKRSQLIISK